MDILLRVVVLTDTIVWVKLMARKALCNSILCGHLSCLWCKVSIVLSDFVVLKHICLAEALNRDL